MRRQLQGKWLRIARFFALALCSFQLGTAAFGLLPDMQQRAIHVLFIYVVTLLIISPTKRAQPETKVPIWDILLILVSIACCVNTYVKYIWFHIHILESTTLDLILGAAIVLVTMEVVRRIVGPAIVVLTVSVILYTFFGQLIPGKFGHAGFPFEFVIQTLNQTTKGTWGFITGLGATMMPMFLIFGTFLLFTGGGQTFIDIALRLTGKYRGGPALAAVAASSMVGTIVGGSAMNVLTTGVFTIPLMKRLGYKPEFAGAVEASASTGGQIMPPIMALGAFVMAEILGISYVEVIIAAAIPAVLYYAAVFSAVRFQTMRLNLPPVPAEEIPPARRFLTWAKLSPLILPVAVLLTSIVMGRSLTTAGFSAVAVAVVLYMFSNFSLSGMKQRFWTLVHGLERAAEVLIGICPLMVICNIIMSLVTLTGIGVKVTELIGAVAGTSMILALIVTAVASIILGMGLSTVAAYLLAVAVIGPALIKLGMVPLTVHLFIFYFSIISALTPPVCSAVWAASAVAQTGWLRIGFIAMRLAVVAYFVPFAFAYEPALLMMGGPLEVALAFIPAVLGAVFIAAGMMGYFTNRLSIPVRMLLVAGGAMLLWPGWQTDLWGIGLIALALVSQRLVPAIVSRGTR